MIFSSYFKPSWLSGLKFGGSQFGLRSEKIGSLCFSLCLGWTSIVDSFPQGQSVFWLCSWAFWIFFAQVVYLVLDWPCLGHSFEVGECLVIYIC